MKKYQSHKVVEAAVILSLGADFVVVKKEGAEDGFKYEGIQAQIAKHAPEEGWYLVKYADGYVSFSPPEAFTEGYSEVVEGEEDQAPTKRLSFGQAIVAMEAGQRVQREGWNGKNMFLWLLPAAVIKKEWIKDPQFAEVADKVSPDSDEVEALGSIRMKTADDKVLTGWLASQSDILAHDWQIAE